MKKIWNHIMFSFNINSNHIFYLGPFLMYLISIVLKSVYILNIFLSYHLTWVSSQERWIQLWGRLSSIVIFTPAKLVRIMNLESTIAKKPKKNAKMPENIIVHFAKTRMQAYMSAMVFFRQSLNSIKTMPFGFNFSKKLKSC